MKHRFHGKSITLGADRMVLFSVAFVSVLLVFSSISVFGAIAHPYGSSQRSPSTSQDTSSEVYVIFNETGLSNGWKWNVSVDGSVFNSTTSYVCAYITSGTYSFDFYSPGYTALPKSVTLDVLQNETGSTVTFSSFSTLDPGYINSTVMLNNFTAIPGVYVPPNMDYGQQMDVLYNDFNGLLYVGSYGGSQIIALNATTYNLVSTIAVGSGPVSMALDSNNGNVFVGDSNSSEVTIINGTTNRATANISVGSDPISLAFNAASNVLYCANFGSSSVSMIGVANHSVYRKVTGLSNVYSIVFDSSTGLIYAGEVQTGVIAVISTGGSILKYIDVNDAFLLTALAIDYRENVLLALTNAGITEVNLTTDNITLTNSLGGGTSNSYLNMYFSPLNGYVYLFPLGTGNIVVYSLATGMVTTFNDGYTVTGSNPMALDDANRVMFVPISQSDSIAAVSLANYQISFTATGITTGSEWNVTLDNVTKSTTGTEIDFVVDNGTYSYSVGANGNFTPTDHFGTIYVSGNCVAEPVHFTSSEAVYTVTLFEVGLPLGTQWSFSENGHTVKSVITSVYSFGNYASITLRVFAGQIDYDISVQGYKVVPYSQYTGSWSTSNTFNPTKLESRSGILNITGNEQYAAFFVVRTFPITFSETGLQPGDYWQLEIAGQDYQANSSSISVNLANGTYNYNIGTTGTPSMSAFVGIFSNGYSVTNGHGTVDVIGHSVNTSISFTREPGYFLQTFLLKNYPTDSAILLTVDGNTEGVFMGDSICFLLPNGTFQYSVDPVMSFGPIAGNKENSSITVHGSANTTVIVNSVPTGYYPVNLDFTGQNNQLWPAAMISAMIYNEYVKYIVLNRSGRMLEYFQNGTYHLDSLLLTNVDEQASFQSMIFGFTFQQVRDYYTPSTTFNVSGEGTNVSIHFIREYNVTFVFHGLYLAGWSLNISGKIYRSFSDSIQVVLLNGTYSYNVTTNEICILKDGSGAIDVNGANLVVNVYANETFEVSIDAKTPYQDFNWSLLVNSTRMNVSGSTVEFEETNGTYNLQITPPAGYLSNITSRTFTINGSALVLSVSFVKAPSRLVLYLTIVIIGVSCAVAVAALSIIYVRRRRA